MERFDETMRERARSQDCPLPEGFEDRLAARLEGLPERRAAGRPHILRTALIAACACLLLAGTAFAAVYMAGGFHSVKLLDNSGYGLYGGGYRFLPVDALSDEVLDLAAEDPAYATKYFTDQDWSAAERFSGVTLPENPALDELDMGGCSLGVLSNDKGPTCLRFQQWTRGLGVSVSADVYTELMGTKELTVEREYSPGYALSTEEYTARSGLSAVIVHLLPGDDMSAWDEGYVTEERYAADFLLDGFRYHIRVRVDGGGIDSPEAALDLLHTILDGFAR